MEVPPEPSLDAGALPHLVLSVVEQQLDLPFEAFQMGLREIRLAQKRVGHRQRVDAVGLAGGASGAPGAGHELGWDPHYPLASSDEEPLEVAGDVTTVLEGEHPLVVELPGPHQHSLVALVAGLHSHLRDRLPALLGSHRGVGLLVWINTHYDHLLGPPFRRANRRDGKDPPADTPQSGHVLRPSSYQVTLASLSQVAGDTTHGGHPSSEGDTEPMGHPVTGLEARPVHFPDLIPARLMVTLTRT